MAEPISADIQPPANPLRKVLETFTGPWTWQNLFSWIKLILLILFLKGCVIDQYSIPSASMEPTLHGDPRFFRGDRVLVNKWWFGARIPFTNIYLKEWNKPERWDIVVFKTPVEDAKHKILIKRVIGLPGETISFKDGNLVVNGEVVPFPDHMPESMHYLNKVDAYMNAQNAENADDYNRMISLFNQMVYGMGMSEEEQKQFNVIPDGHYMMCGDNTENSFDSRMYGWVPGENLYGRAFGIWWPWPRRRDFTGFSYTWWGTALLYGIPILLISLELLNQWRHRKKEADKIKSQ